jgi:multiple sugar transport system permease protein
MENSRVIFKDESIVPAAPERKRKNRRLRPNLWKWTAEYASPLRRREALEGYLFISPWLVGFVLLTLGPLIASFTFSFTDWRIVRSPEWVGFDNYVEIFTDDPEFWQALRVTFTYVAIALPLNLTLSLGLAMLLNQDVPGIGLFRTLFYAPVVLSGVAVSLMWIWLLNPDQGVVNSLLESVGIRGPDWFWHPSSALISIVVMGVWTIGGPAIIYMAGLQNIPFQLYEAANVDGAGGWAKFRHVTLPMLSPTIFFQLVIMLIDAFQVFTAVYVITEGGPLRSTFFYMFYLFRTAFEDFKFGYGSALAWILAVIILFFTVLVFRSSALWVFYESEVKKES